MIYTHIVTWVCGHATWTWRILTFAQWQAMPNVAKKLALIKAGKITVAITCAGIIGIAVPPILGGGWPFWYPGPALVQPEVPVNVPEPLSLAVFAVGLGALWRVRR